MVRGYGSGNFANYKQQQKVMSQYHHKLNRIRDAPRTTNIFSLNQLNSKIILNSVAWSGCIALPKYCLVIKGVNKVYSIYRENSSYKKYEYRINNIIKTAFANISTEVTKDQINFSSETIINLIDESGLLEVLSKETNIDKNIIKDILKGTTSNLLTSEIEKISGFFLNEVVG